jgi:hypothetical protein
MIKEVNICTASDENFSSENRNVDWRARYGIEESVSRSVADKDELLFADEGLSMSSKSSSSAVVIDSTILRPFDEGDV